jgi:antitoxin component of MazEF toxin-antitoxin module
VPSLAREAQELDEKLAQITPDQLHGEIGLEEAVDGEVF